MGAITLERMSGDVLTLDLSAPVADLAASLIDVSSPSGHESDLADALETALREASHLEVIRHGNTVAARTQRGLGSRVVWAGHIDTVPSNRNEKSSVADGVLTGRGSVDMKSGVALGAKLAAEISEPSIDVTWIFYDNEEVESAKNGLGLLGTAHPEWIQGDFAIVGEPTNAMVEGGCNGTIRVEVSTTGRQAHSARSWRGKNAIHLAHEILQRLASYEPASVEVEGLSYREGMNAVGIAGGVAGNVIPDRCTVTVNYRFAPNKSVSEAVDHVRELFSGFEVVVVDEAPGARPGLTNTLVQDFVAALGLDVSAKYGWTDVARFGEWGIPALNYGPGDPSLAHSDDERVDIAQIEACYRALKSWLSPQ